MRSIIIPLLLICPYFLCSQTFTDQSVLSTGKIIKLQIDETGVYKITADELSNAGIDLSNLNPSNIKIYGNGGSPLAEIIAESRIDDLYENNIVISGDSDGVFSGQDHIMFYAEGPDVWRLNADEDDYEYIKNIYSLSNYYFLVFSEGAGKRMEQINITDEAQYTTSHYQQNIRHENDMINLLGAFGSAEGTGQRWFGETFTNQEDQTFDEFNFSDLITTEAVNVKMAFAARSNVSNSYTLNVAGQSFSRTTSSVSTGNVEARYASVSTLTESFFSDQSNLDLSLSFNKNSGSAEAWLDYIELQAIVENNYQGSAYHFYDENSVTANTSSYRINSGNDIKVWDVTKPHDVREMATEKNASTLVFNDNNETKLKRYYAFDPGLNTKAVAAIEEIPNQNLHAIDDVEFVIIYHEDYLTAAENLINHRAEVRPLNSRIVEVGQIYNEFSSGKCDPTAIRDFARMLDTRIEHFNYLLLLGDGSYDYRNIVPGLADQNFIPVYETKESLDPIRGFPSDDYYGLLSENEGTSNLKGALDIAIGRLPAKTAEEANAMVDKIIMYESSEETLGDWRLKLAFSADDEDSNTHINQADDIAKKVEAAHGAYNQDKIYFDAYVQESTPGGARYPDATKKINDGIFKGQLILNYLGHGGPKGWAQERVLKVSDINNWNNPTRLPVIVTATCSFTGYDDPAIETAGEVAISKANGGAVALFTTTRAVYAASNKRLTEAVFDTILTRDEFGDYFRIGEIMRRAKNSNFQDTSTINSRKFTLIGDPTMTLAAPEHFVSIDEINGKSLEEISQDTFGSLDAISLKGHIEDYFGQKMNDFNGNVFITLYDKAKTINTLINDVGSKDKEFQVRENVLFKGSATVVNGEYTINFFIPQDINFNYGEGKISMYAYDGQQRDAAGFFDRINIGGSDEPDIVDDNPPSIQLFINDEHFKSGGYTNADPILIVKLEDDYGINISGTSIGHDISAVLDQDNNNLFILNDFYNSEPNNSSKGSVEFPLGNLEPGLHHISVKAWDIANNSAESSIEFRIAETALDKILNPYSFPNPFSSQITIGFEHDLYNNDLILEVDILDLTGKLVKRLSSDTFAAGYAVNDLMWDGFDDFGSNLANGIYLYQVILRSRDGKTTLFSDFNKIVKID